MVIDYWRFEIANWRARRGRVRDERNGHLAEQDEYIENRDLPVCPGLRKKEASRLFPGGLVEITSKIRTIQLLCRLEFGELCGVGGVPDSDDAIFTAGDNNCAVGICSGAVNVV